MFLTCIQINIVETCATKQNQLDAVFSQLFDNRSWCFIVNEDTYTIKSLGQTNRFNCQTAVEVFDINIVCAFTLVLGQFREEQSVVFLCTKECDPENLSSLVLWLDLIQCFQDLVSTCISIFTIDCDLQCGSLGSM